MNKWITDKLPKNEEPVLVALEWIINGHAEVVRTVAFHTDGKTYLEDSSCWWDSEIINSYFTYDEKCDDWLIPEGWWEDSIYYSYYCNIEEPVLGWTVLPDVPKEILNDQKRDS